MYISKTTSDASIKPTMAEQFKKAMKRDVSSFDIFKHKKQFKKWHRNLLHTATTHDVEEILDPNYTM